MRAKKAAAAQKLNNAWIHLAQYRCDVANEVAQELLADAERRVLNGFGPVPQQDCEHLLTIIREYRLPHSLSTNGGISEQRDMEMDSQQTTM